MTIPLSFSDRSGCDDVVGRVQRGIHFLKSVCSAHRTFVASKLNICVFKF